MPHASLFVQTHSTLDGLLAELAVVNIDAGLVGAAFGQSLGGSTVVVSKTSEVGADADDVKLLLLLQLLLLFLVCLPAYLFYYSVQFGVSQRLGNLATSPSHRRADTAFGNSKHWFVVSYRAVGINSVNTLVVVENKALDGGTVVCFFHISKNFRNLNFSENKGTNNRNTYN